MKRLEKLKVLIDSIKTANELMRKQIEINDRAVELLGEFITEPEQVEPETIKPQDMKEGEWYVDGGGWIYKFSHIDSYNRIFTFKACYPATNSYYNYLDALCDVRFSKSIRKATQQEILKYFPHELEVPTHGGNDAAYIQEVTDPQI